MIINRNNIVIVLVETRASGNIGSVARSMVNMGFCDLRLVKPQVNHLDLEARWFAHGAREILEQAQIFPTIQDAVSDCTLSIAASHKKVRNNQQSISARDIGEKVIPYTLDNKVAIIFGRENHGLSNEEVNLCTWLVTIDAASIYPSLNLAQAVMIICYELFMTSVELEQDPLPPCVGNLEMERFYAKIVEIIDLAGFRHKNDRTEIFIGSLRRIFGRTGLTAHELQVLYKLFSQFEFLAKKHWQHSD